MPFTPLTLRIRNMISRDIAEAIYDESVRNGGGTFLQTGESLAPKGYVVAVSDGSYYKVPLEDAELAIEAIRYTTSDYPLNLIGTWVHEGYIHIDPVMFTPVKSLAEKLARENRQIAYYDLAKGETIHVLR